MGWEVAMRYIEHYIEHDLEKKMVLVSGPRQSGKTTLIKGLLENRPSLYLNFDDIDQRRKILNRNWSDHEIYIAFDEVHKYSRWKNFLKGTYDTQKEIHKFIITGSAKLDIYKKGQDSMVGRFFSWRLHPLCLAELVHQFNYVPNEAMKILIEHGGFPEPFFENNITFSKRWRNERMRLVFRQDIKEIENIKNIDLLELFYESLRNRVTSELVLSNIARDLEVAPKTAKSWLALLEKTYALFTVTPFAKNITKAITKSPKVYFYDNGEVEGDMGAKLENLVANHLLKKIQFLEDSTGDRYELNYIRERNGNHEVDFVIIKNRKPILLIEVKISDTVRSKSLYYFMERLNVKHSVQLVMADIKESLRDGIFVVSASKWLSRKIEDDFSIQ